MAVRKARMEFVSSREELGRLFARLGQELAEGALTIGLTPVHIAGFESFKVSLKEDEDGLKVKVAVKLPKAEKAAEAKAEEPEAPLKPEEPAAAETSTTAEASPEPETPPEPAENAAALEVPEALAAEAAPAPEPTTPRAKPRAKAPAKAAGAAKKGAKPAYKTLKKRMKTPWKDLLDILAAGNLPEAASAERFLADCELMISYRGKGEEYYDAFRLPLAALRAALAAGDPSAAAAAAADMEQLKKDCHGRYK